VPSVFQFCMDYEASDKSRYPTFARTRPPDTQISKSVVSVLLNFQWTQASTSPNRYSLCTGILVVRVFANDVIHGCIQCHKGHPSAVCGHGRSRRSCPVRCARRWLNRLNVAFLFLSPLLSFLSVRFQFTRFRYTQRR
jgi:hypothetical protein